MLPLAQLAIRLRLAATPVPARFEAEGCPRPPAHPARASKPILMHRPPSAPLSLQESWDLLKYGEAAAARMVELTPEDPTSHYSASKMNKECGELEQALVCLRRSLAASKALNSPFYIAQYACSVGFCSVQVRGGRRVLGPRLRSLLPGAGGW
jgi:hypothetical protein